MTRMRWHGQCKSAPLPAVLGSQEYWWLTSCQPVQGGKEAEASNKLLHRIVASAIEAEAPEAGRGPQGGTGLVGLVVSRDEINDLLHLDDVIDLVPHKPILEGDFH